MNHRIPTLDVVVTLVSCQRELLLVWSPSWGTFTFPMTKLRRWTSEADPTFSRFEDPLDASMRNVGESLGFTATRCEQRLLDFPERQQSHRDSLHKNYRFQVCGFRAPTKHISHQVVGQWLTPGAILEGERGPISPTVRSVISRIGQLSDCHSKFPECIFPGRTPAGSRRQPRETTPTRIDKGP